ncbi:MAG TPA: hypothetical protein VMH91_03155 [Candidatus Paceibacterota bacterium]|nr:hypothetical protein [Candidatus Paceibacterota bacterium]
MKPVFLSLVGPQAGTTRLYEKLKFAWPATFPDRTCEFLGDPLAEHWEKMKIGDKRKRDFPPMARLCFRWGFFYAYNERVVGPAFKRGVDVILVRQFGFDVYAGAVVHNDCERSLSLHMALVPFGVYDLELCAPLYVFTEELDDRTRLNHDRYFAPGNGQRSCRINPALSDNDKVAALTDIARAELARREETAVAA